MTTAHCMIMKNRMHLSKLPMMCVFNSYTTQYIYFPEGCLKIVYFFPVSFLSINYWVKYRYFYNLGIKIYSRLAIIYFYFLNSGGSIKNYFILVQLVYKMIYVDVPWNVPSLFMQHFSKIFGCKVIKVLRIFNSNPHRLKWPILYLYWFCSYM